MLTIGNNDDYDDDDDDDDDDDEKMKSLKKNSKKLSRVHHLFSFILKVTWNLVVDINSATQFWILIKIDCEY